MSGSMVADTGRSDNDDDRFLQIASLTDHLLFCDAGCVLKNIFERSSMTNEGWIIMVTRASNQRPARERQDHHLLLQGSPLAPLPPKRLPVTFPPLLFLLSLSSPPVMRSSAAFWPMTILLSEVDHGVPWWLSPRACTAVPRMEQQAADCNSEPIA